VELKQRNPRCGCPRIAQQLAKTFGIEIDKDVVRRILAAHYRPDHGVGGPSWLTLSGHAKGSLWSMDLSQVESVVRVCTAKELTGLLTDRFRCRDYLRCSQQNTSQRS